MESRGIELSEVSATVRSGSDHDAITPITIAKSSTTDLVFQATSQEVDHEYDMKFDYPDGGWRAYSVVFGSFVGFIACFGILNAMGAIQAYLTTHQLKDTPASTISWIFSMFLCLSFAIGVLVGPVFDKRGSFGLLLSGCVLMLGGFMGLASSTKLWQFILSFSICVASGTALCIPPLIGVINHWFFKNRGSAVGIATNGGSVGGIVIPLLLRSLYPKVGFAWAIRILGFFSCGCVCIAIVLAKDRLNSVANANKRVYPRPSETDEPEEKSSVLKDFFDFAAFKDLRLAFLTAGVFLNELSLMCITTYLSTYAIAFGMEESESYILLTVFSSTGIFGRVLSGYLSDILGRYNVMVTMLIGVNAAVFLVWLPFGASSSALYSFAAFCGFFSASIMSLTPVCLSTITTTDKFGQRYGSMYSIISIGNLFGIPIGAAIIGNGDTHNYKLFSMFCGLLTLVGTACVFTSRYFIVGMKLNVKI